jgi:hypothetical protein
MTSPDPRAGKSTRNYLLASIPAFLLGLGVAFLLRTTALSPGARTGTSFFLFVLTQTLFRRILGERRAARDWALVIGIGLATSLAIWFIADL